MDLKPNWYRRTGEQTRSKQKEDSGGEFTALDLGSAQADTQGWPATSKEHG